MNPVEFAKSQEFVNFLKRTSCIISFQDRGDYVIDIESVISFSYPDKMEIGYSLSGKVRGGTVNCATFCRYVLDGSIKCSVDLKGFDYPIKMLEVSREEEGCCSVSFCIVFPMAEFQRINSIFSMFEKKKIDIKKIERWEFLDI